MGAFFLYRTDTDIKIKPVQELFIQKGFSTPVIHRFGEWSLLHYKKQLLPNDLMTVIRPNCSLFAVGTFAYKAQGLQKSIETILTDYENETLNQDDLVGPYCLLFRHGKTFTLLTDRMNLFHVFTNEENTVFSSSFAAVLKAGPRKYSINVPAVIENVLTGYIIGPETIVKNVYLADNQYQERFKHACIKFLPHPQDNRLEVPSRIISFEQCVDKQIEVLDGYFESFKKLVEDVGGIDIGLSGGYDSRVLALMAKRHFSQVSAHTHYHKKITADEVYAEIVAKELSIPFYRCAEAKQAEEMDVEEFEKNLENTATYNDGRVVHDYSWLGYFRTRWYRESVLKDLKFGMNGLSGELYRNHDNQFFRSVNTHEWIKGRIIGITRARTIRKSLMDEILEHIITKACCTLHVDLKTKISHHQTRRYFGELFSIYAAAVRMNIDNQLGMSLSPFTDYGPRLASYETLPHLGVHGAFEAAMIKRMNLKVASFVSNYGYSFDKSPPLLKQAKYVIRGVIPCGIQNKLTALRCGLLDTRHSREVYQQLYVAMPLIRAATELMRESRFGLNWEKVVEDYLVMRRTLSIGIMLLKYEDSIDF